MTTSERMSWPSTSSKRLKRSSLKRPTEARSFRERRSIFPKRARKRAKKQERRPYKSILRKRMLGEAPWKMSSLRKQTGYLAQLRMRQRRLPGKVMLQITKMLWALAKV